METTATIIRTFSGMFADLEPQILLTRPLSPNRFEAKDGDRAEIYVEDAAIMSKWLRTTLPSKTLALLYKDLCNDPPLLAEGGGP